MTDQKWVELGGGLNIAVTPYDKTNLNHRRAIKEMLADSVQKVASVHGAAFSEAGFRNVMRFLDNGDIKAEFYEAAWDVCKPKSVGGAFFYNAIGMDKTGKPRFARYTEDVCLLTSKLRELIREKPINFRLPDDGLAENYEKLSLKQLHQDISHGVTPQFRFGEVDLENTKIVRALESTGIILGNPTNSGVLEFKEIPDAIRDKIPMVVYKTDLYLNNQVDLNNFIVSWREQPSWFLTDFGPPQENGVDLIVTRGFATASGSSIAQLRPVRVGRLPNEGVLDCVIASLVKRSEQEIKDVRYWGVLPFNDNSVAKPTKSSILGSGSDRFVELVIACAQEVMKREESPTVRFSGPMIDSHIHILNDADFLNSFKRLEAKDRVFGVRLMFPATNHLPDNDNFVRPANDVIASPSKLAI